ncbi:MAG: c-type cytochrome [Gallionella sp.]
MFNSNGSISACLALVALLSSTAVLAENDKPATQQPSSQMSAQKQPGNETPGDETKLRIGPGDPVAGKSKAELCFGCHGEDGNSTDPMAPKLAGQYGIYIAKQIRNFQATTCTHQIMSGMAASISDDDLADISAYYASQPMMKGDHPSGNKIGKNLFENDDLSRMMVRCSNCHGATGKGLNPGNPVYPVIGGQHKEYLLGQLINFRKGARNNSPGGVMNITVHRLSDAELEALAD